MIEDKIEETQVTRSLKSDYLDIMTMLKKYEDKNQQTIAAQITESEAIERQEENKLDGNILS
jgi:hypothetical protein